jgi:hypothetical protein
MVQQVNASGNQDIDGLLWGYRWDLGSTLTFSFPTSSAVYSSSTGGYGSIVGFEAFNSAQQTAAISSLQMIASYVSGLSFSQVAAGAASELRFGVADVANGVGVSTAFAYFPGTALSVAGDSWYNDEDYDNPGLGSFAMQAGIMHEIGHTLGLKHGHETATTHGYTFPTLPSGHDSYEYSVMTYRQYVGDSTTDGDSAPHHATTYMINDIAALQYMYGADFATNPGNTTYSWSNATGACFINGASQGASVAGNYIFMSVWDGDGLDTYDLNNFAASLTIDLRPGSYCVVPGMLANLGDGHFARGSIYNAYQFYGDSRSLIESANGGSGSDTIVGNSANNMLRGNGGSDVIYGLDGTDFAAFTGSFAQYQFSWSGSAIIVTDTIGGRDAVDTLVNVEYLRFSNGDFSMAAVLDNFTVTGSWLLSEWSVAAVGSFDTDGDSDLLLRRKSNGDIAEWQMQNDAPITSTLLAGGTTAWTIAGLADVNADGDKDVIWRGVGSSGVAVWDMQSNGVAASRVLATSVSGWTLSTIGDINADGDDDFIWRNNSTTELAAWDMQGGNVLTSRLLSSNTAGWAVVAAGDFNGDGDDDLVWRNTSSTQVATWNMQGGNFSSSTILSSNTNGWTLSAIGDFDGDGDDDIAWRGNDGTIAAWTLQGGSVVGTFVVTYFGSDWTISGAGDFDGDGQDQLIVTHSNGVVQTWDLA